MAEVADGSAMNSAVSDIPTLGSQARRLSGTSQVLCPVPGVLKWSQENGTLICGSKGTFLRRAEARLAQGVALFYIWNVTEPVGQAGWP